MASYDAVAYVLMSTPLNDDDIARLDNTGEFPSSKSIVRWSEFSALMPF